MNFLNDILQNIPVIITIIGLFAVGFVGIYGIFNQKFKDKRTEEDTLEERIRALYQEENKAQNAKIQDLLSKVELFEKQIATLISENKVLKDIFQGKDQQSVEFQKQGFMAIKKAETMYKMIAENNKEIKQTNKNIERLAVAIEKHLDIRETKEGEING